MGLDLLLRTIQRMPLFYRTIIEKIARKRRFQMRRFILLPLILVVPIGAAWAITHEYSRQITILSDEILFKAQELADTTDAPVFQSSQAEKVLTELKDLIREYETLMVFAESPYPGEILLGTTPAGDSTWLETLCTTRYDGLLKEIRIRRTGHRANYLRINDIEITYMTPAGPRNETLNKDGRIKLYSDGVFRLPLPKPMRVVRIRIHINHESTGLTVCGIPAESTYRAGSDPGGSPSGHDRGRRRHLARNALQQPLQQAGEGDTTQTNRSKSIVPEN
jgi:hypothetical protein